MSLTEHHIEQRTFDWHMLRRGCVTGTSLGDAIGSATVQKTLTCKLISEQMTDYYASEDLSTPAIIWGIDQEPFAIKQASNDYGIAFEDIGMIGDTRWDGFKISPDAVSRDPETNLIIGGIEVKCPESRTHIRYILDAEASAKNPLDNVPKNYRGQVLSPFVLSDDIKWWLFMSYDSRNYERPTLYQFINREEIEEDIKYAREKLEPFLADVSEKYQNLTF